MNTQKRIAMAAQGNRQNEMIDWAARNYGILLKHQIIGIGPIGSLLEKTLLQKSTCHQRPSIQQVQSDCDGYGEQLCTLMAEKKIDIVIFFWDPMPSHTDDTDIADVARMAIINDIPLACNRSTADMIVTSPAVNVSGTPIVISDYRLRAAINFTY
jgi:methylglyoxal synthase